MHITQSAELWRISASTIQRRNEKQLPLSQWTVKNHARSSRRSYHREVPPSTSPFNHSTECSHHNAHHFPPPLFAASLVSLKTRSMVGTETPK